ncbi:Aspartate aminotransferase, cytoplasmic [Cladochytrium tenue]|nr:Aspartate aminotransferase, cytoplasmic [Cladochytrium tenue]
MATTFPSHLLPSFAAEFGAVPEIPADPVFALNDGYNADTDPKKINLGIGAYRDNNGKPWVLPVVQKAKAILNSDASLNHEYLSIDGLASFTDAAARLILGDDSPIIKEKRYVAVQAISGTGALRLGADFLVRFRKAPVYISTPTWVNHSQIFGDAGFDVRTYPYWDPKTKGLAFDGLIKTIQDAPEGSIFVLHACAHNPTGVDPTRAQWAAIADAVAAKGHLPFFDCAYQGFASGSTADDAWAVRHFAADRGLELLVAQSFSKNFGLYGERVGNLTVVVGGAGTAPAAAAGRAVRSQLKRLVRASYSNPPSFGARVVSLVLNDPALRAEWEANLRTMADRIRAMRGAALARLRDLGTPGSWDHVTSQIGMFSFTGLTVPQSRAMRERFHIYLTDNGRVSMAGLNETNVVWFADAVDWVVRNVQ